MGKSFQSHALQPHNFILILKFPVSKILLVSETMWGFFCHLGELSLKAFIELTGASYQVFVCSVVDSEAPYKTSSTHKLPYSLNCPCTSPSHGSFCRKAVVVWARSRVERLGKIACGHRDNNCRAWASLWRIIISFKEILGSESARCWHGYSVFPKQ